ncbi:hypothetical protein ACIP25_11540 [Streptomyces massasporeus]|uniref:hypothetical protein n=1 Tax=Streptomyces massasporeus TaxID=67324 RepID=UPI0038239D6B
MVSVVSERERQALLRAAADGIVGGLPAWDGVSPSVWVVVVDPDTMRPFARWRTPATAAPQPRPQSKRRHLHAVREVS